MIKTIKREGNLGWMMHIWRQHGDLTHVRVGSQSFFLVDPFAAGQRICLGNSFSLLETHVIAAMLARRFKLRLKPGHTPRIDNSGTLGARNGLPMLIEAR